MENAGDSLEERKQQGFLREEIESDDLEKFNSLKISRQNSNEVGDLILKLPSFAIDITNNDLLETTYEILLACAYEDLIVPSKEKEDKRFRRRFMRQWILGRDKDCLMLFLGKLDKKTYIRWQKRWLKMLTEGIANHPAIVFGKYGRTTNEFRILLEKIEEYANFLLPRGEFQTDTAIPLVEMCNPLDPA
ncbi:hypothetical protein V6N11_041944 [Hibiscus sabdariffa]|uniref:Uncharacterized protein n=1 Tax=Hibiscus sabdariffa TaxID=183260 RepID=A0ABR2N778_9ROSI